MNLTDEQSLEENMSILLKQLEKIIEDIISHPENLYDKGIKSFQRIVEYHDPDNYGKKLQEIYSQK